MPRYGCVLAVVILPVLCCTGGLSATPIDENGTISELGGCLWFESFRSGLYLLGNTGGFDVRDIVHVHGNWQTCYIPCDFVHASKQIPDGVITAGQPEVLGCGTLLDISGGVCIGTWLWRSPTWGNLELYNPSGYASGDTVAVTGYVCTACGSFCMVGHGSLINPVLAPCTTPVLPSTWGRVKSRY